MILPSSACGFIYHFPQPQTFEKEKSANIHQIHCRIEQRFPLVDIVSEKRSSGTPELVLYVMRLHEC